MFHMFDVDIAKRFGVNAAVLMHNIYFWCEHNRANNRCFHDGYYWTFNTRRAFTELFPYMSERQVGLAIQKLVDAGLLVTGNFNKSAYDRTMWYAVTVYGKSIIQKCEMETAEAQIQNDASVRPIPDINTDINTDMQQEEDDDIGNPFGDYDNSPPPQTIESYVSGFLDVLSPPNIDELRSFVYKDKVPEEIIRYAVDEAMKAKAPRWKYVRAVIMNCMESGYTTAEQARAARRKLLERQIPPPQPQPSDNPLLTAKFY